MAAILSALAFAVYLANLRPMGAADSIPARLLPFSILREGDLHLNEFGWLRRGEQRPHFLRRARDGGWMSTYPVATPLVVTPVAVPALLWLRHHGIEDDDVRFRLAALVVERVAAAAIAALSVALVYLAARALVGWRMAAGVALAYAFATSTWSTSSQALWQHGLAALSLAGLNLAFLRPESRRNALLAGGCAALGAATRPTMLVFAVLAAIFVWRHRRGGLAAFLAVPLGGALALLYYNLSQAGRLRGGYRGALSLPSLEAGLGMLLSPSRGLLVYTPAAALALIAPAFRDRWRDQPWLLYLWGGVGLYVLLYACAPNWWGGHSFGPRFMSDTLPALALLAAPLAQRLWQRGAGRALVLTLALWGFFVQVVGVYRDDNSWNTRPGAIDHTPQRLWDWRDPQILRAAGAGWQGAPMAPLLAQAIREPVVALLRPLPADALNGSITPLEPGPWRWPSRSRARLAVRVSNRGAVAWPAFSDFGFLQVALVYSWWSGGTMLEAPGGLVALPRSMAAGSAEDVVARFETPARAGSYELQLNVVQVRSLAEGTAGDAVLRLPVTIVD